MEIKTERLTLREFQPGDVDAVLAYARDPLYLRYYAWTHRTREGVQEFVGWFVDQQQMQPRFKFQLAITLNTSQQLIGNCGIRKDSMDAIAAEIGYELAPAHWGQGYATEAMRAMVAFGFTQLNLHRITAYCVADNLGSARVLHKLGLQLEGRLREHEYYKGRYWDRLLFGMLESEWKPRLGAGVTL